MDDQPEFDVAILGAGAAGLFAAFRAAELGHRVALVEKNRRPGVKILISGGTRCNLTNASGLRRPELASAGAQPAYVRQPGSAPRRIQAAFGAAGPFLGPALRAFDVDAAVSFFESEGLPTKIEANGKIFPASDRAVDVLDVLIRRLERSGATLFTHSPALGLEALDDRFVVRLPDRALSARRVVIATGGASFPGCGTTGDGYDLARRLGHTIIDPRPALVPLKIDTTWVTALSGLTMPDVFARILEPPGRRLSERRESVLFAHFGLTGPAILDISREVARHDRPESLRVCLDFLPSLNPQEVDQAIQSSARTGRRQVVNLVPDPIPRRLAQALVSAAGIPESRVGPELSRDERRRLVNTLKGVEIPITGTLGFSKAEVTSGGVSLAEVNPETLESRIVPGLHLIGEVLDLDGRIGGYNFQAAWSLGWLVASALK